MSEEQFLLGVDLGGTKILSVCVDSSLQIVGRDYRETQAEEGPEAVIGRMTESARAAAGGRTLPGVGISTPGPSNPFTGVVSTPPNLPGWRDVPLAGLLGERLGLPAWLENDANCAALAEFRLGAGREVRNMLLLTLGTGIGGGLVLDGKLYRGASGAAGELGHLLVEPEGYVCGCGRLGCLEAMASGTALAREARGIIAAEPDGILARLVEKENEEPDARLLEMAADEGDAAADAAIRRAGRYLGVGLTDLVNVFNPELIVLGGSLRKMGDRYVGEALAILDRDAFPQSRADVRIVEAELGDESPAVGAALIAREHLGLE